MLEKVKLALRISHTQLDDEIEEVISEARADLIRSGVSPVKAQSEADPLICATIKSYVLSKLSSDPKVREGYFTSYLYQMDNLRKSKTYMAEV